MLLTTLKYPRAATQISRALTARTIHLTTPLRRGSKSGIPTDDLGFVNTDVGDWLLESGRWVTIKKLKGDVGKLEDKWRVNVVNKDLCDESINLLGNSLDRHMGCDLLDINPGVGLWSTALHERLKPRSHILMEPDIEFYRPKLQHLLDKPGVKALPRHGILFKELEQTLNEEFPLQKKLTGSGDVPRNDSLLVTLNLSTYPKRRFQSHESVASLVLHQLMTSVRTRSLFQQYGLVRMLIWVSEDDKRNFMPKTVYLRRRGALDTEVTLEWMHQVVGIDDETDAERLRQAVQLRQTVRDYQTLLWVAEKVQKKMKAAKRTVPPDRKREIVQKLRKYTQAAKAKDEKLELQAVKVLEKYHATITQENEGKPPVESVLKRTESDPFFFFSPEDIRKARELSFFHMLPDNETGKISSTLQPFGIIDGKQKLTNLPVETKSVKDTLKELTDQETEAEKPAKTSKPSLCKKKEDDIEARDEAEEVTVLKKKQTRRKKVAEEDKAIEEVEAPKKTRYRREKAVEEEASEELATEKAEASKKKQTRYKKVSEEKEKEEETGAEEVEAPKKRRTRHKKVEKEESMKESITEETEVPKKKLSRRKKVEEVQEEPEEDVSKPTADEEFDEEFNESDEIESTEDEDISFISYHKKRRNNSIMSLLHKVAGNEFSEPRDFRIFVARVYRRLFLKARNKYISGKMTKEEFLAEHARLNTEMHQFHRNFVTTARLVFDENDLMRYDPPGLLWDRRDYEPLVWKPGDNFPNVPIALIDMQPKNPHQYLRPDSPLPYSNILFDLIASNTLNSSKYIFKNLNKLWPGCGDGMKKYADKVHDFRYGGSPPEIDNAELLAVTGRRITEELFIELVEVWYKWPFRPSFTVLMANASNDFGNDRSEAHNELTKHSDLP